MPVPTIRAVKTLTISEAAETNSRRIAGVSKSTAEGQLSFRVSGRVATVRVDAGDEVAKGQILATLETTDYELSLQTALADLASARADLTEKSDALKRQQNLKEKEFVAQAKVDQAQAAYSTARSKVDAAVAALENAENDLKNTTLAAPFDGAVVSRSVEAFTEVTAGQTIFEIQNKGLFKIEVMLPETLLQDVNFGDPVWVSFPSLKGITVDATVSQIGAKAENGNAFPVEVELVSNPENLKSGMTAEVTFRFGKTGDAPVYLIPVSALDVRIPLEGSEARDGKASVFVFNDGVVERRIVIIQDIRGNEFEVVDGLKAGDRVIVAGVPFLNEGLQVKVWEPDYNSPATINFKE